MSFDQSKVPIDDDAAERISVTAQNFVSECDDVGAVIDQADQIGRRQRVVDDQWHAGLAGDGGDRLDIGDAAGGIGDRFDEIALVRGVTARSKLAISSGSAQATFQPKLLKAWVKTG